VVFDHLRRGPRLLPGGRPRGPPRPRSWARMGPFPAFTGTTFRPGGLWATFAVGRDCSWGAPRPGPTCPVLRLHGPFRPSLALLRGLKPRSRPARACPGLHRSTPLAPHFRGGIVSAGVWSAWDRTDAQRWPNRRPTLGPALRVRMRTITAPDLAPHSLPALGDFAESGFLESLGWSGDHDDRAAGVAGQPAGD
jgi:hypothetical protein